MYLNLKQKWIWCFRVSFAKDKLSPVIEGLKEIMADGVIDELEEDELEPHR